MPEGIPDVIPPSPEKMDLTRRENDTPRFQGLQRRGQGKVEAIFQNQGAVLCSTRAAPNLVSGPKIQIKQRHQAGAGGCPAAVEDDDAPEDNPVDSLPRTGNVPYSVVAAVSNQLAPVRQVITMT